MNEENHDVEREGDRSPEASLPARKRNDGALVRLLRRAPRGPWPIVALLAIAVAFLLGIRVGGCSSGSRDHSDGFMSSVWPHEDEALMPYKASRRLLKALEQWDSEVRPYLHTAAPTGQLNPIECQSVVYKALFIAAEASRYHLGALALTQEEQARVEELNRASSGYAFKNYAVRCPELIALPPERMAGAVQEDRNRLLVPAKNNTNRTIKSFELSGMLFRGDQGSMIVDGDREIYTNRVTFLSPLAPGQEQTLNLDIQGFDGAQKGLFLIRSVDFTEGPQWTSPVPADKLIPSILGIGLAPRF